MFTVSDIVDDIDRGCTTNNMIEEKFSYRIIVFVRDGGRSEKHYVDSTYHNLRKSLEYIIRKYLSLTNCVMIAQTTALKDKRCVCLQSRAYSFSLDGYFKQINGECRNRNRNIMCGRYAVR